MGFLRPRAVPAMEHVAGSAYTRSVRIDGRSVSVALTGGTTRAGRRYLTVRANPPLSPQRIRRLVGRLLDLDTELTGFRGRVRGDPLLGPLVAIRPGLRITRYLDPFEGTVRAILGQQVSLAAARTVTDRLVRLVGAPSPRLAGVELLAFPPPEAILGVGVARLRGFGLTGAKAAALVAVSDAVLHGHLDWRWLGRATPEATQARLESVRGIGPWTAAYVRMRALGDRDAFLPTDLGIVKAFARLAGPAAARSPQRILDRAEPWRPWRAYATLHLWRALAES